jgi:inosine/xanthosine triphosphatase
MMKIIVGSKNPVKVHATEVALTQVLNTEELSVTGLNVSSGVPDQPMTEAQTRQGAINRVKACMQEVKGDWYIAIEGGVDNFIDGPATFAFVAICNGRQWSVGRSANLPLPASVFQALEQGEELGDVMDRLFQTKNIKQQGGAIGLLTHHLATRQSVYEIALILAMSPFMNEDIYTLPGANLKV